MRLNLSTESLWRVLPVAMGASAILVAATFVIALTKSGADDMQSQGRQPPPRVAEVLTAAPPWKMQVTRVGDGSRHTRTERARYRNQRPEVKKVVRRVFDAWLLGWDPKTTIERSFAAPAEAKASKLDLVVDRESAEIRSRRARIGIEGRFPRNAAAEVVIRGSTWIDRATLWMHRGKKGWKVIAFEVDRKARG